MQTELVVKQDSWAIEINGFPVLFAQKCQIPTKEREIMEIGLGNGLSPLPVMGQRKRPEFTLESLTVKSGVSAADAWFESGLPQDVVIKAYDSLGTPAATYQCVGAVCPKIEYSELDKKGTDFFMQTLTITMADYILK